TGASWRAWAASSKPPRRRSRPTNRPRRSTRQKPTSARPGRGRASRVDSRVVDHPVAVITGGGRGIGRSIALALAAGGARVGVAGRSAAPLAEVARHTGGLAVACDVTRPESVVMLGERVRRELGDPEIVVTSAGVSHATPFAQETPEGWDEVI